MIPMLVALLIVVLVFAVFMYALNQIPMDAKARPIVQGIAAIILLLVVVGLVMGWGPMPLRWR